MDRGAFVCILLMRRKQGGRTFCWQLYLSRVVRRGQAIHLLTFITVLKHAILSAGAITLRIVIPAPSLSFLRWQALRLEALLLRVLRERSHLHTQLLAQLLKLSHRLHRIVWVERRHGGRRATWCVGWRILCSRIGVTILHVRSWPWSVQVQIAFVTSRATTAARLLERSPPL